MTSMKNKRRFDRTFQPNRQALKLRAFDNDFRILSIDGGGARGMIPAVILKEIESRSGKRISDLFDRICGTSTGAILACALAAPEKVGKREPMFKASEIVEIYRKLGKSIFSRGSFSDTVEKPIEELLDRKIAWIATHAKIALETVEDVWRRLNRPLHDIDKLASILRGYLGELRMDEALTELFVYAYDVGSTTPQVFGSTESSIPGAADFSRYRMYQAATASSAAVPFFAPFTLWEEPTPLSPSPMPDPIGSQNLPTGSGDHFDMVDGGNGGLGSPALFATLDQTEASTGRQKFVLSLGTGHYQEPVSKEVKKGGFLQWLLLHGDLLRNVFDGEADAADMALRQMEQEKLIVYARWQPSIPESLDFLDEGSRDDMDKLESIARAFIAQHDEDIDAMVETLLKPRLRRAS